MRNTQPASYYSHQNQYRFFKGKTFHGWEKAASFLFYSTCLAMVVSSSYLLYSAKFKYMTPLIQDYNKTKTLIQPKNDCDLSKGQWIPDARDPLYTNYSCKTLPSSENCFLYGRNDTDFLHWRWKPDKCELPRFRPQAFLSMVRGKTMAFIGDSLARNQMESLLCLLSTVETPISVYKDVEDRFTTWEFTDHSFTLMVLWSKFLVIANERMVNGTPTTGFDIHLDKIDRNWSNQLPLIDYAILSDAQWFFRQNYLYEGGNIVGCVYCQTANVTDFGPGLAIRKAFRAAFKEINNCKSCKKIFTLLRTYSPTHYEGGGWNTGGGCYRTKPYRKEEVNRVGPDWDYRKIQMEEVENARNAGEANRNTFEILDITEMMWMRADGHPGLHWDNRWKKGYSDCLHWCLPGPVDTWNELLFEVIERQAIGML